MSVAQNIAFGLRMRKADPNTIRERVEQWRALSIDHLLDRKPRHYLVGNRALGRAIARQPKVFY